jgi:hypothetical protein
MGTDKRKKKKKKKLPDGTPKLAAERKTAPAKPNPLRRGSSCT